MILPVSSRGRTLFAFSSGNSAMTIPLDSDLMRILRRSPRGIPAAIHGPAAIPREAFGPLSGVRP